METQTLITFGAGNYRYGTREVQQTVAHELAHAWYGDTVTPDDWSDLWMNEGMAMYVEAAYSVARGWRTAAYWDRQFSRSDSLWRRLYGPPGAYHPDQFAQINVYYCAARMWAGCARRSGRGVRRPGAPLAAGAPQHRAGPDLVRGLAGRQHRP